ncbi:hypothetical protein QQ045_028849 [Rhodiola kirilowii]
MVTAYFSSIFQSTLQRSNTDFEAQLRCISPVISKDMNDLLLRDISDEEVRVAMFALGPLKAPGVDGFPAIFYQKHWEAINKILIVLIPKKNKAICIEDCRPISLCTVAMNIITKIISQRLQPILNQVISIYQSAFVKGRIITDNFVVAHEVANFLKCCKDADKLYASVKVAMSKAYDRVEWTFLENLLSKMGFAKEWVERTTECVCSVSYLIKVNDRISDPIVPSRGLRQGDPFSPYLFLLCTELLNAMLLERVDRGLINGIRICGNAPTVLHLFFADDSIFFIKAVPSEARTLKEVLNQYETVSGQLINFEKSEIYFSRNTPADVRMSICDILRVPQVSCHSKYLGLPLIAGQRKIEIFREILEKVWRRVKDWKSRLLSVGGREILIKSILQAIPTYMMSVYRFPHKVLNEIYKLMQHFWWDKK